MSAPLRMGLVGTGSAGTQHAQALKLLQGQDAVLAAVCSRSADACESFCRKHELAGVPRFGTLEAMLRANVCDAVILATPDNLHSSQVLACLGAGLHVLAEKPLALSLREGEHLLDQARRARRVLEVGYHLRHHAGLQLVHDRMESYIGRLRNVSVRWAWKDPATQGWRASGAAKLWSMSALGTHCVDLAMWFAGSSASHVMGLLRTPISGEVDRAAELCMRFDRGILGHVSVAVDYRGQSRLLLAGDHGDLECVNTLGARGSGKIWFCSQDNPARREVVFQAANPYAAQLRAFAARAASAGGWDLPDERLRQLSNLAALDKMMP